jgi:uncharacterized protein
MPHPVVHFEIGCKDSAATQVFYSKLFGWSIQPMGPAAMIDTGGAVAGHITELGHEPHRYTIFYVEVEDVQAHLDKAAELGGKTLVPPVEIPTGTFAWMQDPQGNTIGLWKPAKK